MSEKPFKLTANLTIEAINLGTLTKNIKTNLESIKVNIPVGIDLSKIKALQQELAKIKKAGGDTAINVKLSGATKQQIANIRSLGRALEKYGPAITNFRSKSITVAVKAPTKATIKNLGDLSKKLATLLPVLNQTTSRNVLISVKAPTTKTIDNINKAGRALNRIQPILQAMGGGANIGIKVTGLGAKRMENFANSLTKVQANIGKATPALHNLNTILQSKINHLNQFKQAATNAGAAIASFGQSSGKVRSATAATAAATKNLATETHHASSFMYELGKSGFLAVKRFSAFMIGTTVIFGFLRSVTDAFREFVDFEKNLARIAQVTGSETIKNVKGIADEVTRLSINLGVSSKDLLAVSQTFAQAGLRGYELQKALEAVAATDLSPTFTDMNNTGEGLIAMMGQFKIKADEFKDVFGSINAVSATYAVESDDLITAIRTVGGVFSKASNESKGGIRQLQELLAIFTSIRSTTRESAETISTGLRTIFTRIQRPKTIEFLRAFGIELTDSKNNFIGAYEAAERLSEGLKNLGVQSLSYKRIQEELGGYRQVGKVIPLLSEYKKRQDALQVAMEGTGSLEEQAGIQLETLSRRVTQVAEDFKKLIREIAQTSSFKLVVDVVLNMATAFIKLAEAIKPVLPMLLGLMAFKGGLGAIQFIRGAISQLPGQSAVIAAGAAAQTGIGGIVTGGIARLKDSTVINRAKRRLWHSGFGSMPPTHLSPGGSVERYVQGVFQSHNALASPSDKLLKNLRANVGGPTNIEQIRKVMNDVSTNLKQTFGEGTKAYNNAMKAAAQNIGKLAYRGGMGTQFTIPGIPTQPSPIDTQRLTQEGIRAGSAAGVGVRSGRWAKLPGLVGMGLGKAGSYLADRSGGLMIGGMLLQNISGDNAIGQTIGKTLTGAGIGGMIGGHWGAAAGAILAGISGIADALGPDKIVKANNKVAEELKKVSETFADFYKGGLETIDDQENLRVGFADLAIATNNIVGSLPKLKMTPTEYAATNKGEFLQSALNNILDNKAFMGIRATSAVFTSGASELGLYGVKKLLGGDVDVGESIKKENIRQRQIASQNLQAGLEENSLRAIAKFKEIVAKEGDIFTEEGKLTTRGQELQRTGKYDFSKIALSSSFGNTSTEKNLQLLMGIMRGDVGIQGRGEAGVRNLFEAQEPAKAEAGLKSLDFALKLFRLTLEDLGDVLTKTANANQRLSQVTEQYYDRALSGPSTTRIINVPLVNPFANPGALESAEMLSGFRRFGIGQDTSIGSTLTNAIGLRRLLPQIINSARGQNLGDTDIRASLIQKTVGEMGGAGKYSGGVFNNFSDEEKDRVVKYINSIFQKEGSPVEIPKEGAYDIVDKIYGDIFKESSKILEGYVDQVNQNLEKFANIIGKNLEIWQKVRTESLEMLATRQGYDERRANLFTEESLAGQRTRLDRNRLTRINLIGAGPIGNMRGDLFGPGGLLARQAENERRQLNPFVTPEDQMRLLEEASNIQNSINKWVDVAKIGIDVERELVNVEQQILQEQKKREAGRNIVGTLASMDPFQRMEFMKNLGAVSMIAAGKRLESNKQYEGAFSVLEMMKNMAGTPEQLKRVDELMDKAKFSYAQATGMTGILPQVDALGVPVGESPKEKALATEFDNLTTNAQKFSQVLFDLTRAQEQAAIRMGVFNNAAMQRNVDFARMEINRAEVIMRAPEIKIANDDDDTDDVPVAVPSKAKGGKLGGTGPIPIIAHGGELIIPKGNVDRGMSGVVEFAKKVGIPMFARGGIVSYKERQEQKRLAYKQSIRDRSNKYWGRKVATKTSNDAFSRRQYYLKKLAEKSKDIPVTAPDDPSLNEYFGSLTVQPRGFRVVGKYDRGSITPEMQALKDANLAKRRARSQPVGDMLGVNVPLIGNVRRGGTNDRLFDDSKLRYASDYDFRKDEDVKREAERIWQEDRTKLASRQTTSAGYSYQGALQEAVNRKRDSLAFDDFDSNLRSFNEAGSYSFTREEIRDLDLNKLREMMREYEKEFGNKNSLVHNLYNFHQKLISSRGVMKASWSDLQRQGFQRGTERTKTNLAQYRQEGEELARMKVLGQHAWTVLNSGVLDDNDSQRLSNLLTKGKTGLPELRIRQREIENIIGGANRTRGQLPNLFPKFSKGTPLVTKNELNNRSNFRRITNIDPLSLIDEQLKHIGNDFGARTNLLPTRLISQQEAIDIGKRHNISGVRAAYFRNENRIGVTDVNTPTRILAHEYAHSVYRQFKLDRDTKIQQIIKDATEHVKERYRNNPDKMLKQFGPEEYVLSPSEMFSNIMMVDSFSQGNQYKKLIIDYLKSRDDIPKFNRGTPLVTKSGLAEIHKGEAIVPAKAVSPKNNQAIQAKSAIDDALIKAANALSNINIPERIVLEFGTINHNINFNGNDVLAQQVAKQISEMTGRMIQQQLSKVISPVSGETMIG